MEMAERSDVAETFVALVETSADFIAMAGFDGRVLYVNRAGRELLGLAIDADVTTLPLSAFHTGDGLSRAAILREKGSWRGEGVLRHFQTGELIPTQVSSFIVKDQAGKPLAYATVQRDLRETQRLEAQLRQAQKMEAVGTLARGIAHDFNNILQTLLGHVELARIDLGRGRPIESSLDEIAGAGRRASALVQQILTFSRRTSSEKQPLQLGIVVEEATAHLRPKLPTNVSLVISIAPNEPEIMGDRPQLQQVVANLCANALRAVEATGGQLTLVVDELASCVRLQVTDDGVGMDAATVARVFDPFFTTKTGGSGTGLGLSVVHGLVKEHHGTVEVRSELGRGTTVEVRFPLLGAHVATFPPAVTPPPIDPPRGEGRRVLYVDDDEPLLDLTERLLGRFGYDVTATCDADDALALLKTDPTRFDVLVTDANMPGTTGLELSKRALAMLPELPIILVSGYVSDELRAEALALGVRHVLDKPDSVEGLCRAIHLCASGASPE